MRLSCFLVILVSALGALNAAPLRAREIWTVVSASKLDGRIVKQVTEMAREYHAPARFLPRAPKAAPGRGGLMIELQKAESPDSFVHSLQQTANNRQVVITSAQAREGYTLSATSIDQEGLERVNITAADARGFHYALLRVPQLVRSQASRYSQDVFAPTPKFSISHESGRNKMLMMADFPSFPERGIVEGFYGKPWSHQDRMDMMRFEGEHGMNVYYYAPKDDAYHRARWDKPYPHAQMKRLGGLVSAARANFVDFCFALSPGLTMTYSSNEDFAKLTRKLASVSRLGVSCFALFLDDVPQELQNPQDIARFKTLAGAHAFVINKLYKHLKSRSAANRLVVTPTVYTNEWGSRDYIRELGATVDSDVPLVWTGVRVVSPTIIVAQAKEWGSLLQRKPLVWDNFPVNDGIRWRLNFAPMRGRDPELPAAVQGLFSNPMNQALASKLPLATCADYLWNSSAYDPEASLRRALVEQYGEDAPEQLAVFLKTYGDYWWDENIFKPLFVEGRGPIDVPQIEQRLAQLSSASDSLRTQARFKDLDEELSPFARHTRSRLDEVLADPAFRHLPDGKIEWRDDYEILNALRVSDSLKLDGEFAKWEAPGASLYFLDNSGQILRGKGLWGGPHQFSVRIALGWSEKYFYIGVDAMDPNLYQPFVGRDIAKGDVITLFLETGFRKNFYSTSADGDDYHLFFSPGNFAGVEPSIYSDEDYLPPRPVPRDYNQDIKTAWKKTETGFSGDIAIPASYFEGGAFTAGYEIGLTFGAQKAFPTPKHRAGSEEEARAMVFGSKTNPVFPARFGNPSSYQRLVLIGPRKP